MGVGAITGPRVIGRMDDHPGAHGIELDIALTGQEIPVRLRWAGAVAAFPEAAAALVSPVDVRT